MNSSNLTTSITIPNRLEELMTISVWLEELGEAWYLPMQLTLSLNLVLEEALTNTILYGYEDQQEHAIRIDMAKMADELIIVIADDGKAFDPTIKEEPDITLSVEERPIGGLGILLIKKIMDCVEYQRLENKNILTLKKCINL